jgi:hypothetical protein
MQPDDTNTHYYEAASLKIQEKEKYHLSFPAKSTKNIHKRIYKNKGKNFLFM